MAVKKKSLSQTPRAKIRRHYAEKFLWEENKHWHCAHKKHTSVCFLSGWVWWDVSVWTLVSWVQDHHAKMGQNVTKSHFKSNNTLFMTEDIYIPIYETWSFRLILMKFSSQKVCSKWVQITCNSTKGQVHK